MKYFDELVRAMDMLSSNPKTIFIGQSVVWDGHALFKTLKNVPLGKRLEMPVAEDMQMGFSTGLALEGFIPISIFPRWDFLILAMNQMVNHLDKVPLLGSMTPKVIIRTSVGSKKPLDPGLQHCQDYTEAIKKMVKTLDVIDLIEPEQIYPSYEKALTRLDRSSTLLVEHMDFYNDK
ncbi:MAG: hypothetical protein WC346_03065 [Methanogenium sp.]|jgi:pyruvate/2-oxoglutarate/acetoin dehydrogenase E1 component